MMGISSVANSREVLGGTDMMVVGGGWRSLLTIPPICLLLRACWWGTKSIKGNRIQTTVFLPL